MQDFVQQAEAYEVADPVSRAVFERDGYKCQGCGAYLHLHRHSHLKAHSIAQESDCVTLCAACHALYHQGQAEIEWLGGGKIRYVRKQ
jgi:predicted HNH restriction endonuclease